MIQTYFNRYEIKYRISLAQRDKMIQYLKNFMHLDSHTSNGINYEVRSVYYDSPVRKALQEKINGLNVRKKLRVRYYPNSSMNGNSFGNDEMVFLEIKRKFGENVSKSRIVAPMQNWKSIMDENSNEAALHFNSLSPKERRTLEEIWFLHRKFHLYPVCVVVYQRQAFLGNKDPRFRITFDSKVQVRSCDFDLHNGTGTHFILPPEVVVMEVKFTNKIPIWATKFLNVKNVRAEKVSKFAHGLQKTHTVSLV
ncbi:MAG: VTC domain-containing protein [Promethearchaeota archaeon]